MATQEIIVELDADTSKFSSKMRGATSATDKLDRKTKKTTVSLDKFRLSSIASAISVSLATAKIIAYADAFTSITNKLKLATKGTEDLAAVTSKVFKIANETGTSVSSSAELYAKLERSTRTLNISQERLLNITSSINKSFAISGATTQEASGAIRQLGQAFASGALRGDEFNSIAEQAPLIMEAVSKSTGKTAGELRILAAQGLITSDVLIKSLESYSDKINSDFSKSTRTFSQLIERATNNAIEFVGANDGIKTAVTGAGNSIVFLSEHLAEVVKVGEIAAIIYGGRLTGALGAAAINAGKVAAGAVAASGGIAALGRAGDVALKLMGGWIGLLATLAISAAVFIDWESEKEKQLKKTTKEIKNQIESIGLLDDAQRDVVANDAAKKSVELTKEIAALIKRVQELRDLQIQTTKSSKDAGSGYHALGGRIDSVSEKIKLLTEQRDALQKLGNAAFDITINKNVKTSEDRQEKIDLELRAKEDALKKEEERRIAFEGEQRIRELDAIDKRQQNLAAENETAITALQDRLDRESELIDLAEENKNITETDAMEKRLALAVEFRERLLELSQTDLERIEEQNSLELELNQQLLDQKLISEEEFVRRKNEITQKGITDRIDGSIKEGAKKAQVDNATAKFGLKALDEFAKGNKKAAKVNFEVSRALKLGEAVTGTAAGIAKAMPNIPLAIAVGAMGAAQIATISSQTFEGGGSAPPSPSLSAATQTQPQTQQQTETSTLDLSVAGNVGNNNIIVKFDVNSGDALIDAIAGQLNEHARQGRG